MLPIYICEDEEDILEEIEREIKRYVMIHNYDMELRLSTTDPEVLLEQIGLEPKRGIYFLDVDLCHERLDGFHLGQGIRKHDVRGFIVYVTAHDNLAFKTFQYHIEALDYIVKSSSNEMLAGIKRCLDTIVKRMAEESKNDKNQYFTVKIIDTIKYIPISEIYYFETSSRTHRIILYAENERIDFLGKLQEIEKELPSEFVRTHRSFLVNENKIKELNLKNNEVIMMNGQSCLLSRAVKPFFIKKFNLKSE